jgi:diguanylate cyclase (GGDEF)-like protein
VSALNIDWRGWLRSSLHATTFLGLALIALSWGGVEFYLGNERTRAEAAAIQNTANLARLFGEHVARLIRANDRILRQIQMSSVNGTLAVDFARWSADLGDSDEFIVQLSIADANGMITTSSLGPLMKSVSIADRDHFRVHADSTESGLFIGPPIMSRLSGQWSIQLSRALRTPHGAFAGVVVASIGAERLARFFDVVDLGPGGAVNLVGRDGIVRASAGMRVLNVGTSMKDSLMLKHAAESDEGWFVTTGTIDGVKRIMSYRVLDGYSLVLGVGAAEAQVFGEYWRRRDSSRGVLVGLTIMILIVIVASMRHRRRLELARLQLRDSEERARNRSEELALTLENINQGIIMVDAQHELAQINRQAVKLLGLPEEFLTRRPKFQEVVSFQAASGEFGSDLGTLPPALRKSIRGGGDFVGDAVYERTRPDGSVLEIHSIPLPQGGFVRTFTDITDRKRSADKIAHMAMHDPLTGLANRSLLRSSMESALARQRRQGETFALLLIDLDRFKAVNDTRGHGAGDELLKMVAQRLRGCVREIDTVARLGGDEFAILQSATESREKVETLARRLVELLSAPYPIDGTPASIGASIGIARSHDTPDIEQLFHNADIALYRVKSEGRNDFRLFEPEMNAAMRERRQLEADLRLARERGELEIHYQPIVALATGRIVEVEALLRWNHPTRGRLSPADFIPVAEEIGQMAAIDAWVIETACAEAMRWPAAPMLALNLSPAKFKRRTLIDAVRRALASSGLAASRLEFEISERMLLRDDQDNLATLQALRDLGVRIALDDFGVGHSSLSDLRAFRFDKIKIDQSFVRDIAQRADCAAIVASIASLGRSLGADTTAEGVETAAQAELVRAAGCTQAQGYLYSRPLSAAGIAALLAENEGRAVA